MSGNRLLRFAIFLGALICVALNAVGQVVTSDSPAGLTKLNHIIFMAQENRSLDHYFGELRQYWADNGYADRSFNGLPQFNTALDRSRNDGCKLLPVS